MVDTGRIRATVGETMRQPHFHLLLGDIVWIAAYVCPNDNNIKSDVLILCEFTYTT
jgi:hypothetical protein